jgi:hypothetical protein
MIPARQLRRRRRHRDLPDGRMFSDSFPLSESEAFTSLAGISYPVGS